MLNNPQLDDFSHKVPCVMCGACCRWEGEVKISEEEITRLANFLKITEEDFIQSYTQLRYDRKGLGVKMLEDGTCIFLGECNVCRVHSVKPSQCKGYPFRWRTRDSALHCQAVPILLDRGVLKKEYPADFEY